MEREKRIVRTSVIGILANVLLAAFKAAVGLLAHSIAVTLDAVNNLSDALSSVITILGTKLSGKAPDKKHPYGYGRVEYLSAAIISVIVLYAGVSSLVESVKKIITPETPDYSPTALIIVGAAVLVKLLLGRYVSRVGKAVGSDSLSASGKDALLDAVISASTLAAAGVYLIWGVKLEAWLGAVISLVIIKSGVEMLRETLSRILGERVEGELSLAVKQTVASFDKVYGAYDLMLHSYGPEKLIGSVHIEVPDTMTAGELDILERDIAEKVYVEHHVILAGVSVYAMNTRGDEAAHIRDEVRRAVMAHEYVMQLHGFYLDEAEKTMRFDIVLDFAAPDRIGLYREICEQLQAAYPDYRLEIVLDTDVSD